jgi:hypothetical protein
MAVVADIDGLDLWIGPHEWTEEEREEVRQAIQASRERETHPEVSERVIELLLKIRASAGGPDSLPVRVAKRQEAGR